MKIRGPKLETLVQHANNKYFIEILQNNWKCILGILSK
jgi:hypothetical protein